jgi:predicted ATPase
MTLGAEHGFLFWGTWGRILEGWALTEQGQTEKGLAQMCPALAAYQATGADVLRSYWLALLAEGYGKAGQVEEGLRVVAEALAAVRTTDERWWETELYRLQGELFLRQTITDEYHAESCFHQALTIARRQGAKSLELRVAMSLARLWQQQGKRQEAYNLLASVYGWFTEGFDTADLQEAKALLAALA